MHAVLALAASHMELTTYQEHLHELAIQHRVLAIKGAQEALVKPHPNAVEGDALLASLFALAFQSSYMNDGLEDFFQTVRGCYLAIDAGERPSILSPHR